MADMYFIKFDLTLFSMGSLVELILSNFSFLARKDCRQFEQITIFSVGLLNQNNFGPGLWS